MFDTLEDRNTAPAARQTNAPPIIEVQDVSLWYDHGETQALKNVSLDIPPTGVVAFIGPSGCGKTTLLKCLNRMHDETPGVIQSGRILLRGQDINAPDVDPPLLRKRFGWVAQRPNPFMGSVYHNVAYGAGLHGAVREADMPAHVEDCLRRAYLWDEVKDRLHTAGPHDLSIGQQQRLCVARALATLPEVVLMDEPTGSVDPIATEVLEDLIVEIGKTQAVVIITHSMMQAKRISDLTCYFHLGELVEVGRTAQTFAAPIDPRTQAFIQGAVG